MVVIVRPDVWVRRRGTQIYTPIREVVRAKDEAELLGHVSYAYAKDGFIVGEYGDGYLTLWLPEALRAWIHVGAEVLKSSPCKEAHPRIEMLFMMCMNCFEGAAKCPACVGGETEELRWMLTHERHRVVYECVSKLVQDLSRVVDAMRFIMDMAESLGVREKEETQ